jgi:glycosyltransferase involved in cell wall biosynthesis
LILQKDLSSADAVYAFNSAALELLRAARNMGKTTILDQSIAPRYLECRLLEQERARWPGWESGAPRDGLINEYCERERQEWGAADLILCGSQFVRDGIAAYDGPVGKCRVVPFGADGGFTAQARPSHDGPLRVLTVGTVSLRKGSPYVLEAAKRMIGIASFRMVGAIAVSEQAQSDLRRYVELTGVVPRSRIIEHYRWADVLLLPSLCEGSANATYEALATGLPVICTLNTGSVVREGTDGYIVRAGSIDDICRKIELFAQDPASLREMSMEAAGAHKLDMNSYPRRLVESIVNACHRHVSKRQDAVG